MQNRYRYTVTLLPTPKDPKRPALSFQTEDSMLAEKLAAMLHTAQGYFYEPHVWGGSTGSISFQMQGVKVERTMIAGDMAQMMAEQAQGGPEHG